jgi:hypothetical protein
MEQSNTTPPSYSLENHHTASMHQILALTIVVHAYNQEWLTDFALQNMASEIRYSEDIMVEFFFSEIHDSERFLTWLSTHPPAPELYKIHPLGPDAGAALAFTRTAAVERSCSLQGGEWRSSTWQ